MNEKQFQSIFTKWVRENYQHTAAFELKVVNLDKKKSLSFSSFQEQQIPSLFQAKHGCVYKKLSDMDPSQKPFDAMQICESLAFVVVLFYKKRTKKIMYWVDVDDWKQMVQECGRSSATEDMIRDAAIKVVKL